MTRLPSLAKQLIICAIMLAIGVTATAKDKGADALPLESSSWRDAQSGEWVIGLYPQFAIYDSKAWDYAEKDFAKGKFTLTDGDRAIKVTVGKEKDGLRRIRIGKDLDFKAARITGQYNVDYPADPALTDFTDNGYRVGDSATINGWLKDMPEWAVNQGDKLYIKYKNIITASEESFEGSLDSLGRFSITMPVPNTQRVTIDWMRTRAEAIVEPGETYYLLADFSNDGRLWMGRKSRIDNEIAAHPIRRSPESAQTPQQAYKYGDYLRAHLRQTEAMIDSIAAASPNLSPLWAKWQKTAAILDCGYLAACTSTIPKVYIIPENVESFMRDEVIPRLPEMPTAYHPTYFRVIMQRTVNDRTDKSPFKFRFPINISPTVSYTLYIAEEGHEALQPEIKSIRAEIDALFKSDETNPSPSDELADRAQQLVDKIVELHDSTACPGEYELHAKIAAVDSLRFPSPIVRDMAVAMIINSQLDHDRTALPECYEAAIDSEIDNEPIRTALHAANNKYKRLAMADVALGSGQMVPAEDLEGITEGEEIFKRVVEPFRGRLVLIDVWGTWCGPCKAALKEFAHEREVLDPYGVVYMFFANNSPEQAWKNVIAEYGITGDSVVQYRLPDDQQRALEHYLRVSGYPTYVLVNTDGTPLFDINADPRFGTNALVNLIESMK